jgi:hypothetical protein
LSVPDEIARADGMIGQKVLAAVAVLVVGAGTSGCVPGKRPFLIAQVCLRTAQDVTTFTQELELIAKSEGAVFIDASKNTEKDLREGGNTNVDKMISRPLINMGIERGHGIGLMAGNLGLRNGVAIGFSEGSNPIEAHRFADRVVSKLGQKWHVEFVPNPAESGALPMANCR